MNFEEVGQRYTVLRTQYENREISVQEYERAVKALVAVASDGKSWYIDPYTVTWVELGTGMPPAVSTRKDNKAPETLLQLFALMFKGLVKSIPRMILIGLAVSVLTWVFHTYLIAKVNDGLMYNSARAAVNSVVHLQQTYFPGVNAFWGLLAYFLSSFLMRIISMGPRKWLDGIGQFPNNIQQSFVRNKERAPGPIILGAFIALLILVLYRNFMLSWVLFIGFLLVLTAHFQSMEVTVLRLGLSDLQKLLGRRIVREGEEYDMIYLALLGAAGGFFLAGLWRARLIITLIAAILLLAAFILLKVKETQKAAPALLLLAAGTLLFLENPVYAWCEGGSLNQAGGSWITWWGSNNADLVRRLGFLPAAASFVGSFLGIAAAALPAAVTPPSNLVTLQGPAALRRLQELGYVAPGPDGSWIKTGDWNNTTAPGSPVTGYVVNSQFSGNEIDPNIIITVEPGQAPYAPDPADSDHEPYSPPDMDAGADQSAPETGATEPGGSGPEGRKPGTEPPPEPEMGPQDEAGTPPEEDIPGKPPDEGEGPAEETQEPGPDDNGGDDQDDAGDPGDETETDQDEDNGDPGDEQEPDAPEEGDQPEEPEQEPADNSADLTPEQLADLKKKMDQVIKDKLKQGYFVRNSGALKKVFWNFPLVGSTVEWAGGWTGGQCGEYGEWGAEWSKEFIREAVGDDAIVTTTALERNRFKNHRATKVIMPNGERYVFDYWESMNRKEPKIYTEQEWMDKWKKDLGGNPQVIESSLEEMTLKNYIKGYGEEKGIELFRRMEKNSGKAETVIRSYRRAPW